MPEAPGPDTLSYGRYTGWAIEALTEHDPDYLEWLARSPGGRVWQDADRPRPAGTDGGSGTDAETAQTLLVAGA